MTITVKDVIKAELLRVCLETTTKFRTKHEKKEKKEKYTSEEVEKVRGLWAKLGYTAENQTQVMEIMAILHDAPELKRPTVPVMEPFCVVVCEKSGSGHPFGTVPAIHVKKRDATSAYGMANDGSVSSYAFNFSMDAVRFATDDEVKSCIDKLSENQWHVITTHEIFRPIMDAAMAKAVQVDDETEEKEGEDNGEVTIYGRSITVSDE